MKKFKLGHSIYRVGVLCSLGGVMLSLLLTLLASICIISEYLNISLMYYVMYGIHLISTFIMTIIVWKNSAEKKLAAIATAIIAYYLVFFFIAIVMYNAVGEGIAGGLISGLCGVASAVVLCNWNKKEAKPRKRRAAFR